MWPQAWSAVVGCQVSLVLPSAADIKTGKLTFHNPSLPAQKFIMRTVGMDCGPVRLPLLDLSADEKRILETELARYDLLRWVAGKKVTTVI